MKMTKRFFILILTFILCIGMVSCGEEKKEEVVKELTPSECLKIQIDVYLFGKNSERDKIGITDETINHIKKEKQLLIEDFSTNTLGLNKSLITLNESKVFVDNIFKGLESCEINYVSDKIDNDKAEVTLIIQGLDIGELYRKVMTNSAGYAADNPGITEKQLAKYTIKTMEEFFNAPTFVNEGKVVKIPMKKVDDYWRASDDEMTWLITDFFQNFEDIDEMKDLFN